MKIYKRIFNKLGKIYLNKYTLIYTVKYIFIKS